MVIYTIWSEVSGHLIETVIQPLLWHPSKSWTLILGGPTLCFYDSSNSAVETFCQVSECLQRNGSPFFLQSCSQSSYWWGALGSEAKSAFSFIPQVFCRIQVRILGWAVHFWNLIVQKLFPHRPCFIAGSIVMLIETIIITELIFYCRQYVTGQNVLVSFLV
jgi:hypothetical protein